MTYTIQSMENIQRDHRPFLAAILSGILQRLGKDWNLVYRVYRPGVDSVDLRDIGKRTVLVLWGDERSRIFPEEYFHSAGAVVKCYCPEAWEKRGIIPVTDNPMNWTPEDDLTTPRPCSLRGHGVFFSGNLNNRRTDLFRGLCRRSFGWPFRISACAPTTGKYPWFHKAEALVMNKWVRKRSSQRDFSTLYPKSFIHFNHGFCNGSLSSEEYQTTIRDTKIVWCPPGFMTNETSRLIEAACAGCVVMVGRLPDNDLYRGNPFVQVDDWRSVRNLTEPLLRDDDQMNAIGSACRDWYLTHFSPSAQAERIAAAIHKNKHGEPVKSC